MLLSLEFDSVEHMVAVHAYYESTRTPGQHTTVPAQQTVAVPAQPVAVYTGPLAGQPVTPAAGPAVTGPVDGFGVPWNGNFHASTKTQTLKGKWKSRKGRDEAAAAAYEAQFGQPAAGVPLQAAAAGVPLQAATAPAVTYPVPGPAAGAFSFAAPSGPSPVGCTANEFLTLANHLMSTGRLSNAALMSMCAEIGVSDPNTLQTDDMARAKIYGKMMAISAG